MLKKYNLNTANDLTAKKNNTAKQILLDVISMLKDLELHKPFRNQNLLGLISLLLTLQPQS